MRFACILVGWSIVLIPFAGSAQQRDWLGSHEKDGPYVGLTAGWLHLTDVNVGGDTEFTYNEGFLIGVQGGYKYGVLRGEIEFEYGRSSSDGFEVDGVEMLDVDSDFDLFRWNAGLYYDFDNMTRVTPYFGGGLGGVYADQDEVSFGGATVDLDDTLDFTAHGEAGVCSENIRSCLLGSFLQVHLVQYGRR